MPAAGHPRERAQRGMVAQQLPAQRLDPLGDCQDDEGRLRGSDQPEDDQAEGATPSTETIAVNGCLTEGVFVLIAPAVDMATPMMVKATTSARALPSSGDDHARVSASVTMTVSAARTVVTPGPPVNRNRPCHPAIGLPAGAKVPGVARIETGKLETVKSSRPLLGG